MTSARDLCGSDGGTLKQLSCSRERERPYPPVVGVWGVGSPELARPVPRAGVGCRRWITVDEPRRDSSDTVFPRGIP